MDLLLDSVPRKILAATAAAAATFGLALLLWNHFQVDRLEKEGTVASLERAIALEPERAALENRLGRLLLFSTNDDPGAAIAALDRATELAPRSGAYWVDLAMAREMAGDVEGAGQALARARAAEPRTPAILWQEMNFALRLGQTERALGISRELLEQAPEYTNRVLPVLAQVTDTRVLLSSVVPGRLGALSDSVEILCREARWEAAGMAWKRLTELGQAPSLYHIRMLLDGLIAGGEVALAQRVWDDSIRRGWIAGDVVALQEPLYNGDFRQPLLNFGFDWRVLPHSEASVWIEGRGPQPGQQSLCVEFAEGARADFAHVVHAVTVEPDTYYALHGFLRSSRLASRRGAFLAIQETLPSRGDSVTSVPLVGTNGWQEVSLRFRSGPAARLAQVALVRPGVAPSEAPATGLVCMAALEWKPLGPAKAAGKPGAGR